MTDLVIDTNSLVILDNEDTLGFIIENNDVVYVPRCVIRKECPSRLSPNLRLNIERGIQRLKAERPSRYYAINPHGDIHPDLARELRENKVEDCDIDVIKLCKERNKKRNDVKIITTNKRHFQKIHKLRQHCTMICPEDYPAM